MSGPRLKAARISVRRHGSTGRVVAAIREFDGGRRRLHVTEPHDDPWDAAITARGWARVHGFTVQYVAFEHGLTGPAAVGDFTVEAAS